MGQLVVLVRNLVPRFVSTRCSRACLEDRSRDGRGVVLVAQLVI